MATAYTSGDVMNAAAALMNDVGKSQYTFVIQLPYLKMAMQKLEQAMDIFENPYNQAIDAAIDVAALATTLTLPGSFFLPISLMERADGSTSEDDWVQMNEVSLVDASDVISTVPQECLQNWSFFNGAINFVPAATTPREVRLKFWRMILVTVADENYTENYIGANNFLAFQTAAYLSKYIARNEGRAIDLTNDADEALEVLITLISKNKQGLRVRRKPFRVGTVRF